MSPLTQARTVGIAFPAPWLSRPISPLSAHAQPYCHRNDVQALGCSQAAPSTTARTTWTTPCTASGSWISMQNSDKFSACYRVAPWFASWKTVGFQLGFPDGKRKEAAKKEAADQCHEENGAEALPS